MEDKIKVLKQTCHLCTDLEDVIVRDCNECHVMNMQRTILVEKLKTTLIEVGFRDVKVAPDNYGIVLSFRDMFNENWNFDGERVE